MAKGSKCPSEVVFKILSDEIASFIQPFICHARFPVSLISNIRSIPVPLGVEGSIASIHLPSTISPACNKVSIYPSIRSHPSLREIAAGSWQVIGVSTTIGSVQWLRKRREEYYYYFLYIAILRYF